LRTRTKTEGEKMYKKYNNIQDISTTNLYKMLSLNNFQDEASQKMIKDEIKFRNEPVTQDQMINIFKMGIVQNCK
jgi:hypothetical protein